MNLPQATSKWCFISSQCQVHSNAGNKTAVQFDRNCALLWANLTIEYLHIFSLLQGSLPVFLRKARAVPGCFLSELWEREDSVQHSSHFLRNPTEPKAEQATACAWFMLWNSYSTPECSVYCFREKRKNLKAHRSQGKLLSFLQVLFQILYAEVIVSCCTMASHSIIEAIYLPTLKNRLNLL